MCEISHIATNLELDNKLLSKAMKLGGMKTKREAVHEALDEYVRRREQLKVLDLFGSLEEDAAGYNYKAQRWVQ